MGVDVAGLTRDTRRELRGDQVVPIEPLYLRRPDAEVPNPLKHVLGHAGADKA